MATTRNLNGEVNGFVRSQNPEWKDDGARKVPNLSSNEDGEKLAGSFRPPSLLNVPARSTAQKESSDILSDSSSYSFGQNHHRQNRFGRLLSVSPGPRLASLSPTGLPLPTSWQDKADHAWTKNKGLALVCLAQLFGVMMSVTTRLLEMDGKHGAGMHPFQILFARMIGTLALSLTYQWLAGVKNAPFGPREVWKLLISRGVAGFFGVYGMYYSLQYLPLSDATVITFLAPTVACWACSILIHEPFTRSEQVAGLISFLGVILIARPLSLISSSQTPTHITTGINDSLVSTNTTSSPATDLQGLQDVTATQRLSAVGVALVGVLGAACAYTTIRWIGQRAHPLISVNYFAFVSAVISTFALTFLPNIGFRLPASLRQWIYLIFLGLCGFIMQFLLTAGLAYEKSSRATNMVYTQMLFALAFDKIVWNTSPGLLSIVGSSLILGSALYVAVHNTTTTKDTNAIEEGGSGGGHGRKGDAEMGREEEEIGLVGSDADLVDDDENDLVSEHMDEVGPLHGAQGVQLRDLRIS